MDDAAPLMNVDWIRWFASVQKAIETPVSINLEQITMTSPRLLGRTTAGTGAAEQISIAGNLSLSGGVLTGTAPTGAALTGVDDANITLTLGGSPTVALLAATSLTLGWSGTLAATRGGTGLGSYAVGDILYASTTSALSRRAIGSAADVLTVSGGLPVWAAPVASGLSVIVDDTTTNAAMFPTWVTAASGSLPLKVSSTKISFNPSIARLHLTNTVTPELRIDLGTGTGSFSTITFHEGAVVGGSFQYIGSAFGTVARRGDMALSGSRVVLASIRTLIDANATMTANRSLTIGQAANTITGIELIANSTSWFIDHRGNADATNDRFMLGNNSLNNVITALQTGHVGLGTGSPTAWLHLKAGTTAANAAPLKFTSGTNLTTAEAGAMEYNGTNLFFTRAGTVRENVLVAIDNPAAPGTSIGVDIVNYYGSSATNFLGDPNRWLSVNVLGATYKIPIYT